MRRASPQVPCADRTPHEVLVRAREEESAARLRTMPNEVAAAYYMKRVVRPARIFANRAQGRGTFFSAEHGAATADAGASWWREQVQRLAIRARSALEVSSMHFLAKAG